ncbi:MAG: hypothetical protein J1E80_10015, partial [Desulfovibrionaceae bacterium]|nr:hypothetical protein [Desulfovibrionaceae bacterium]
HPARWREIQGHAAKMTVLEIGLRRDAGSATLKFSQGNVVHSASMSFQAVIFTTIFAKLRKKYQ